jgi:hypothetical protein
VIVKETRPSGSEQRKIATCVLWGTPTLGLVQVGVAALADVGPPSAAAKRNVNTRAVRRESM